MQAAVRFIFFFTLLILHQISALAHSGDATGFASIQVQGQIVRYTLTPAPTLKIDAAKLADTINKKNYGYCGWQVMPCCTQYRLNARFSL